MLYNLEEERGRVYEMLSQASVEDHHYTQRELLKKSVDFALSEYEELASSYDKFFKSVDHLVIFRELLKPKVMRDTVNLLKDARTLILKEYKKEDLESMPTSVYNQVVSTQKKRLELLNKVGKTYLKQEAKE